jgi:type I restriction enzyme M protein
MIAIGPNFFYTVTLPCTLWFLDKGKTVETPRRGVSETFHRDASETFHRNVSTNTPRRRDTALFIDARNIYRQVDRAHREFTDAQIEFLGNIVRLYRGEPVETSRRDVFTDDDSAALMKENFPKGKYRDVAGLCKVATLKEIEAQGWSLNPGRYVGVTEKAADDFDFKERLEKLNEELETLNAEARELEERIGVSVAALVEKAK